MRIIKAVFIALILMTAIVPAAAAAEPYNFLAIPAEAQAVGMGRSYAAVTDDPSAIYWNPAGLAAMDSFGFSLNYGNLYGLGLHHGMISAALPWGNGNTIGINAIGMWPSSSAAGMITTYPKLAGTVADSSYGLSLAYARRLGEHVHLGIAAKGFMQTLGSQQTKGFGFDVGAQFLIPLASTEAETDATGAVIEKKTHHGDLTIGLVAHDIYSLVYQPDGSTKHQLFRPVLGVAYLTPDQRLTISAEAELRFTDKIHADWRFGTEFKITDFLVARAGVDNSYLTLGAGLNYKGFTLDYAYKMEQFWKVDTLNASHYVTFGYQF